ncbi:Adenylate kinase isoenzyme 6 [Tolypocladium ophioglossoides CBS 100239]|uniref:Adenylate kinase isoenzyme 6 n=1 Tax=Tolypocladium ophioglossoides (strain CBS 100239) TaxID=1163406 RepID=A0A0L0NH16_TOLOC|nr:Adenylate kinase isoenzyme 6 [Tolypocladium ophioglossoides CBS 100239]
MRQSPNIIVTGTPGVGKTTHCESLAERTGLRHVSVNQIVKDRECHEGWSDEYQSWIVDEDKVTARRHRGGCRGGGLHHRLACVRSVPAQLDRPGRGAAGGLGDALRPARGEVWLRLPSTGARETQLTQRTARHYAEAKLQENLDSEIMEVLLQEAREAFDEHVVIELASNTSEEMESNLDRIEAWAEQWKQDNAS